MPHESCRQGCRVLPGCKSTESPSRSGSPSLVPPATLASRRPQQGLRASTANQTIRFATLLLDACQAPYAILQKRSSIYNPACLLDRRYMKQHRAEGLSQAWPSHNILIRAIPQIASVGAREDRLENKRLMVCKVEVFFMAIKRWQSVRRLSGRWGRYNDDLQNEYKKRSTNLAVAEPMWE